MDNQSTYLFGQRFKNRLFVGGLPLNTTAKELADFFSIFSPVIEAKVIKDNNQVPKGYGFVTFTNEEAVRHVTDMGTLFLRNKKLNLGPAVKKQITPVETPELVVVNTINMRGEYFLPVTEQCLPLTVPPYYQYPTYTCSPPAGHTVVFENYPQPVIPFSYAHYPAGEQQCAPPPVPSYSYPKPELQIQRQQSACQRRRNVPPRFRPREH